MIGKKGDWTADTMPFMIIFVFIVGILVLIFVITTQRFVGDKYLIPEGLENFVVERRIYHCFGAVDPWSGRENHLTIDLATFNKETLDRCYTSPELGKTLAYELTLRFSAVAAPIPGEPDIPTEKPIVLKTSNWDESGVVTNFKHKIDVLQDKKTIQAELIVSVQNLG